MKYPQPPFKKYIKTDLGAILEVDKHRIEPSEGNGKKYGWEIIYSGWMIDDTNKTKTSVSLSDLIIATADTKEELL